MSCVQYYRVESLYLEHSYVASSVVKVVSSFQGYFLTSFYILLYIDCNAGTMHSILIKEGVLISGLVLCIYISGSLVPRPIPSFSILQAEEWAWGQGYISGTTIVLRRCLVLYTLHSMCSYGMYTDHATYFTKIEMISLFGFCCHNWTSLPYTNILCLLSVTIE